MDMNPETREIYPELKRIENDIQTLKILLVRCRKMPSKTAKLEGLLKEEIKEEDIEEAKKSIFKFGA
jgi:hypothetical protein